MVGCNKSEAMYTLRFSNSSSKQAPQKNIAYVLQKNCSSFFASSFPADQKPIFFYLYTNSVIYSRFPLFSLFLINFIYFTLHPSIRTPLPFSTTLTQFFLQFLSSPTYTLYPPTHHINLLQYKVQIVPVRGMGSAGSQATDSGTVPVTYVQGVQVHPVLALWLVVGF